MEKVALRNIALVIIFVTSSFLYGQKVGLVLSGGGSKGAAHIGVIKALEEHGIPIDYIGGTSAGAIVGGLYAAGFSPEEMEAIFTSPEILMWATGIIDPKYRNYFKEPEPTPAWIKLRFDLKKGEKISLKEALPANIVSPNSMDFEFMQFFASADAVSRGNFDSLFIPFRCVATNPDKGAAVAFKSGNLGNSIRASMTFPLYFAPIEFSNTVWFDGGIYNNFPSNIIYDDFHPEMIIGSKVASGNVKTPLNDPIVQIENLIVRNTDYTVIVPDGVMIEPKVLQVDITDFSHSKAFIDSGYVATIRNMDKIKAAVERRITKEEVDAKRKEFNDSKPNYVFEGVNVNGVKKTTVKNIRNIFMEGKDSINLETVKQDYFGLITSNELKSAYPYAKYNPLTSKYRLYLDAVEYKPFEIQLGLFLTYTAAMNAFMQVSYKFSTERDLSVMANTYLGVFYKSGKLEFKYGLKNRSSYFKVDYTYNQKNYYTANYATFIVGHTTPSRLLDSDNGIGLSFVTPVRKMRYKLEASLFFGQKRDSYYPTNTYSEGDTPDVSRFNYLTPQVTIVGSTLDYMFPSSGYKYKIGAGIYFGGEQYLPGNISIQNNFKREYNNLHWFELNAQIENYFKITKNNVYSLGAIGQLVISNQPSFSSYNASVLASKEFLPTTSFSIRYNPTFRSPAYLALGLANVINPLKNFQIRIEGYFFQPYQAFKEGINGSVEWGKPLSDRSFMLTGALVYKTPIGPLSMICNYYHGITDPWWLSINLGFLLFNRSGYSN